MSPPIVYPQIPCASRCVRGKFCVLLWSKGGEGGHKKFFLNLSRSRKDTSSPKWRRSGSYVQRGNVTRTVNRKYRAPPELQRCSVQNACFVCVRDCEGARGPEQDSPETPTEEPRPDPCILTFIVMAAERPDPRILTSHFYRGGRGVRSPHSHVCRSGHGVARPPHSHFYRGGRGVV